MNFFSESSNSNMHSTSNTGIDETEDDTKYGKDKTKIQGLKHMKSDCTEVINDSIEMTLAEAEIGDYCDTAKLGILRDIDNSLGYNEKALDEGGDTEAFITDKYISIKDHVRNREGVLSEKKNERLTLSNIILHIVSPMKYVIKHFILHGQKKEDIRLLINNVPWRACLNIWATSALIFQLVLMFSIGFFWLRCLTAYSSFFCAWYFKETLLLAMYETKDPQFLKSKKRSVRREKEAQGIYDLSDDSSSEDDHKRRKINLKQKLANYKKTSRDNEVIISYSFKQELKSALDTKLRSACDQNILGIPRSRCSIPAASFKSISENLANIKKVKSKYKKFARFKEAIKKWLDMIKQAVSLSLAAVFTFVFVFNVTYSVLLLSNHGFLKKMRGANIVLYVYDGSFGLIMIIEAIVVRFRIKFVYIFLPLLMNGLRFVIFYIIWSLGGFNVDYTNLYYLQHSSSFIEEEKKIIIILVASFTILWLISIPKYYLLKIIDDMVEKKEARRLV